MRWTVTVLLGLAAAMAVEPRPVGGERQRQAAEVLLAVTRQGAAALADISGDLLRDPPLLSDPLDPDLYRPWLSYLERAGGSRDVQAWVAGHEADCGAKAWDRGWLEEVDLAHRPIARQLLGFDGGHLPEFALPQPGRGPAPPATPQPIILSHGWLLAVTMDGRVRWQRSLVHGGSVAVGRGSALVLDMRGALRIAADGSSVRLPPVPAGFRPWAIDGDQMWFRAGDRLWMASGALALPEPPLGPPLLFAGEAWWLTRRFLVHSRGAAVLSQMPHLLSLSGEATLASHPRGAVVRDGDRWWLIEDRIRAPLAVQAESALLAGDLAAARSLTGVIEDADLRRRIAGLPLPQGPRPGPEVDPRLPSRAWDHSRLGDEKSEKYAEIPHISLISNRSEVVLAVTWDARHWWRRTWPALDESTAPSRCWSLNGDALVVVEGSAVLRVYDRVTGNRVVICGGIGDLDPQRVVRCGSHQVAWLEGDGTTVSWADAQGVRRSAIKPAAQRLSWDGGDLITEDGRRLRRPSSD